MSDTFSIKKLGSGLNPTKGKNIGKFIYIGIIIGIWIFLSIIGYAVYQKVTEKTIGTQQTIANAQNVIVEAERKRPAFSLIQWGRLSVLHLDLK